MTDHEIRGRAAQIIAISMGNRTVGRGRGTKRIRNADEDPLAAYLGVEAIVTLVEEARAGDRDA